MLKTSQPHPVFVGVGVEVAVEQRLERRSRGHGLGETALSRLAVLQGPVPHRGQRRVRRIRGRIRMQHISPAIDGRVALPEVLSTAELGGVIYYENVCFLQHCLHLPTQHHHHNHLEDQSQYLLF